MRPTKYWIIVASKNHTNIDKELGITQNCHDKATPLKRIQKGDFIIYYSSKEEFGKTSADVS